MIIFDRETLELDRYLVTSLIEVSSNEDDFNILSLWKQFGASMFSLVSHMIRDQLTIQVSIVAS